MSAMPSAPKLTRQYRTKCARLLFVFASVLSVTFCAGVRPRTTAENPARISVEELWIDPLDLEARDLLHGAGGRALAPDPSAPYELIAVDNGGYSPGYDVRDPQGIDWSVKLGLEAQPEVVVSRVLWAIGYHQPPTYLLPEWQLTGSRAGRQQRARFRRESDDATVVAEWSWYENPFVTTRPFKGLIVANLILNNWDWKTSNNKIYEVTVDGATRRQYVVRDVGASLGKTTLPWIAKWTPFRAMAQGTRNDVDDFDEQGFIKSVSGGRVEFHYRGIHDALIDTVTVDDVMWTCRLLARMSDDHWHDAFRAAGYDEEQRTRYIVKLRSKIQDGLALGASLASPAPGSVTKAVAEQRSDTTDDLFADVAH
jgi:hypothetical protein